MKADTVIAASQRVGRMLTTKGVVSGFWLSANLWNHDRSKTPAWPMRPGSSSPFLDDDQRLETAMYEEGSFVKATETDWG